jgi:hypothetical protein
MPKNKISEYSSTAGDNTDIGGINIGEGMAPSDVNNAMREQMSQLKEFLDGSSGDTITTAKIVATTATILSGQNVTGTATFNSSVILSSGNEAGFRDVPQVSKSEDYTLVITDAGKQIFHPSSDDNARTFTIPANSSVAFPVGTAITFINRINTLTIAITTDTLTLANTTDTGSMELAVNGIATAIKIDSTNWLISGVGVTAA